MYITKFHELIEKDNITFTSLCKQVGIDRSTLGKYINGDIIIPLKHLNTLCNYFHVSLDYIFGFQSAKNYNHYSSSINLDLFAKRLRNFRKEKKLTQQDLSKVLNCSHSAISEYENKKRLISTSHVYYICLKYNISADYLLGKTNNPISYK